MTDFKELLKPVAPSGSFAIYIEHGDGSRVKLGEAGTLKEAMAYLKMWTEAWARQMPKRFLGMVDHLTLTLTEKGKSIGVAYIDPVTERSKHPGDLRINRAQQKRKPIS